MKRLEGKRVLITGVGSGQGEAAQRLFAEEGARVLGCDVQEGKAEASAKALQEEGFDVHGYTVDLTNPDAAREWVEKGKELFGGIDVMYNNAAGYGFAPFSEMTLDLFKHVLRVELEIVFNTTSPVWKIMTEGGGGSIITTSSASALRGSSTGGTVAHAGAKGAVISMTKALAAEGAEYGIRANAISPGFILTPASEAVLTKEMVDEQIKRCLIRRPGKPIDVAYAALFLASDESAWITGQNISVDGGQTAGFRES